MPAHRAQELHPVEVVAMIERRARRGGISDEGSNLETTFSLA